MGTIRSHKNSSGSRTVHYNGKDKLLSSHKGSNGRVKHYDSNGRYAGSTREGHYGRVNRCDKNGVRTGTSYIKPSGAVYHHPANNQQTSFGSEESTHTGAGRSTGYTSATRQGRTGSTPRRNTYAENNEGAGCLIATILFFVILFLIT